MIEPIIYHPSRQRGLLIHGLLTLVLIAAAGGAAYLAFSQQIGAYLVFWLLLAVLFAAPLPLILYRAYALIRAAYWLERDGLRLRWGLRAEDIPLTDIEWVRRASDMAASLPVPRFSLPGALTGTVNVADLGLLEYLAADMDRLVLIATTQKVYAISPEDTEGFIQAFQRTLEMGSLTPIVSVSVLPAVYLAQVWSDIPARVMLLSGLLIALLLFILTSLAIPDRQAVALGFYPNGQRLPWVPSAQLLLLPILAGFVFLVDLLAGLFFYRWEDRRLIAYLLWAGGMLIPILLSIGTAFILF